ncbi:MAG: hypothetical protein Q4F00_11675 [bacterium]|nr:hypothetical protein [bacterium]
MFKSLFQVKGTRRPVACGIEAGITLVKIALRDAEGSLRCFFVRYPDLGSILTSLQNLDLKTIGVTGRGAISIKNKLRDRVIKINEFVACGAGARYLLKTQKRSDSDPFVLVDVGTGTSIMAVKGSAVTRLGGTALGGGTLVGLGRIMTRRNLNYGELCDIAQNGLRSKTDLQVRDVYEPGEINISPSFTAANFGKVALGGLEASEEADWIMGLIGLIGENISLLACSLAENVECLQLCYGGATLRNIPALTEVLLESTQCMGKRALILPHCEYLGALGALDLSSQKLSTDEQ